MDENKIKKHFFALKEKDEDYLSILNIVGDAKLVLIGESTHGTEEFYQIRADITKHLIKEKGFNAIAIEGDWPDTHNINKFVRNDNDVQTSDEALSGFKRFPTWMWRNNVVKQFIEWLKEYNLKFCTEDQVGFYGLDLYSLNSSIEIILRILEKIDPKALIAAKQRYSCFNPFKEDLSGYGYATSFGMVPSCQEEVILQLLEINENSFKYLEENLLSQDEVLYLIQNARLVKNAERYYRSMFQSKSLSWNLRDMHMAETLDNLYVHLNKATGQEAKIIVWAHNSHIGDARNTEHAEENQWNLGQLVKEKHGNKAILIGSLTYSGTVTAASAWDGIAERKKVRHALNNSYENFFHQLMPKNFVTIFRNNNEIKNLLPSHFLERAIGVIYKPETERFSHYFYANIYNQFDALIYLDKTNALIPLETNAIWHQGEVYETFPSGL